MKLLRPRLLRLNLIKLLRSSRDRMKRDTRFTFSFRILLITLTREKFLSKGLHRSSQRIRRTWINSKLLLKKGKLSSREKSITTRLLVLRLNSSRDS